MDQIASYVPSRTLPVRDEQAALLTAGGDRKLAADLFAAFLQELPPQFDRIRSYFAAREWPSMREAAHRLHGSTAYCGVPALKKAVKELELAAEQRDIPASQACMDAVIYEIGRLLDTAG